MKNLNNVKYSKTHEWVKIEEDGTALIGISDYAQKELGGVVFVNLPMVGDMLEIGKSFADIESVKAVSDVYSPLKGTVCEINEYLLDNPQDINSSPYTTWLVKVQDFTLSDELMDFDTYQQFINQ